MSVDTETAATALDDIARVERRTREAIGYAHAGANLIWWGVLTGLAYAAQPFVGRAAPVLWGLTMAAGMLGTVVIAFRERRRRRSRRNEGRIIIGMLVLLAFGLLWTSEFHLRQTRELDLFWLTLSTCGLVLAGLWLGRFLILCGVAVTALAVAGYLWAGNWYDLYMAAVDGVGMVAAGVWLRRYRVVA